MHINSTEKHNTAIDIINKLLNMLLFNANVSTLCVVQDLLVSIAEFNAE